MENQANHILGGELMGSISDSRLRNKKSKFDFKIILNNENQRDIIVEIDSVPNDVVIIYDDG